MLKPTDLTIFVSMNKLIIFFIALLFSANTFGQKSPHKQSKENAKKVSNNPKLYRNLSMIVILETKNYHKAVVQAFDASKKLRIPCMMNPNNEDSINGFVFDSLVCKHNDPFYLTDNPLRRWKDGKYSDLVEQFNIEGKSKKRILVVVASGKKEDMINYLPKVRSHYSNAVIETQKVYMGCQH